MRCLLQKARKTRRRRRRKNGNAGRNGQLEKREQMGKNKTCFRFSYGSICFFYGSNCFSHGSTCFPPESIRLSRIFPPSWNVPAGEDRTAGSDTIFISTGQLAFIPKRMQRLLPRHESGMKM